MGELVYQAADGSAIDVGDLKRMLHGLLRSPGFRPPMLPGVALDVMQLAQRPTVEFEEVVRVLEKDPLLASRVLSLSQSAFYASRSPIRSLHQAAVRLGLKTLRDLVLEASLHLKIFRAPGYEKAMERLARHSSATAHVVRLVCRRTPVDAEFAFLCGLLHDVGFAACLLALSADPHWRGSTFEELAPVLDEVHQEASGILAQIWKLPEPVARVVARHTELRVGGEPQPVVAALVIAEQLAWEAGCGMEPPPPDAAPLSAATPEPPLDGLDASWTGAVEEALGILRIEPLAFCAARADAFAALERLGLAAPRAAAGAGAHRSEGVATRSPPARPSPRG
jgi:HD-like signal output (HDOD) protein